MDQDEGPAPARAEVMHLAGGQALAGAGFAQKEHGHIGGGDLGQLALDPTQRRAGADELSPSSPPR